MLSREFNLTMYSNHSLIPIILRSITIILSGLVTSMVTLLKRLILYKSKMSQSQIKLFTFILVISDCLVASELVMGSVENDASVSIQQN